MTGFQHRTWHKVNVTAIIVVAVIREFPDSVRLVFEMQIHRHLSDFGFLGQFYFRLCPFC